MFKSKVHSKRKLSMEKSELYLWLVRVQSANATLGGVTKSLEDMPGHCGLNRTWRVELPAGTSMVTTVTPGFGWSDWLSISGGSLERRVAFVVPRTAPEGAFKMVMISFWSPMVRVAELPETSTDALVCMRHWIAWLVLISSWRRTCLRALSKRMPRENDVLQSKR